LLRQPEVTVAVDVTVAVPPVPASATSPLHVIELVVSFTVQVGVPTKCGSDCASTGVIEEADTATDAIAIMATVVNLIERLFFNNPLTYISYKSLANQKSSIFSRNGKSMSDVTLPGNLVSNVNIYNMLMSSTK
jgi:hypothetical protein